MVFEFQMLDCYFELFFWCVLFRFLQNLENLPATVAAIYSDDPATQLEATTQFRRLLSIGVLMFHEDLRSRLQVWFDGLLS